MTFTVLGLQSGPNQWGKSYAERIAELNQHLEQELNRGRADLVVLPELMTVPYQCTVYDDSYFEAAEQLQGPTFQWLAEKARHYQTTLIGTIFEQATEAEGVRYYNTALVVSPEGHLVGKYRKTHIAKLALPSLTTDEKYYFSAGDELPVFTIGERKVGILICFDRSFPEAARALAVQGAELIVIPTASSGADRAGMWLQDCAARARENGLFLIGVNKGGTEIFLDQEGQEHRNHYFGLSCAFNPRGEEVVPPLNDGPWQALRVEVDFSQVEETRSILNFLADYRPQLYQRYNTGPLLEEVQIVRQTELNRETEPLFMPRQGGEASEPHAFDATVVSRLKQAGAVLLGKTTTTEYAFFGGAPKTRNLWNTAHTPGGSSSGSAAALAASMALFTLGTQTAGSLLRPAAYNGLTTLKATYGRISKVSKAWWLAYRRAFSLRTSRRMWPVL